jgi:SAM-dependent methyltransferase
LTRFLVNSLLVRRLPGPFVREQGNCWVAQLPRFLRLADNSDAPRRSTLALYEDGVPLTQAHSLHTEIRDLGLGRYSHWENQVLFSSADNSDPNSNGRRYSFSLAPWLYRRRTDRPEADFRLPVNHRKRDANPAQIRTDVEYALSVGKNYLNAIRSLVPAPAGKSVLEVGPGINYGCVMYLAAHGMRPMVADRFLAPWEEEYHTAFYSALRDEVARREPQADVRPLTALVKAGGYPERVLARFESPLERIPIADDSVDIVFSNAVVEHLYDLDESFAQLYRITRPGGFNLHQVDFRDHRDFSRPLEYLLLSETDFQDEFARRHGECGNRYRPDETTERMRAAGFDVLGFEGNIFSEPAYLQDFLPRLQAATASRYRRRSAEELRIISGFYRLRKPMGR